MRDSLCIVGSSLLLTGCVVRAELEASLLLGYASQSVDRGEFLGKDLFHLGFEPYGANEVEGVGELEVTAGLWQGSFNRGAGVESLRGSLQGARIPGGGGWNHAFLLRGNGPGFGS